MPALRIPFRVSLIVLAALLVPSRHARADVQVEVSFPLGDYYRPGRYLPVRVAVTGDVGRSGQAVRISADGAVTTELEVGPTPVAGAVVPWLMLDAAGPLGDARWSAGEGAGGTFRAPRPLGDGQRLVGHTTGDAAVADDLFDDAKTIVAVRLDPADPLPGDAPVAWQALDALVLDGPSYLRMTERELATLAAAGTVVAVRMEGEPPSQLAWPWERRGEYWVLRHEVAGPPTTLAFAERAYEPSLSWRPGRPAGFRRQVVLLAAVYGVLALGVSLWRSRRAAGGAVALSVVATVGLAYWTSREPPVVQMRGVVVVVGGGDESAVSQRDEWVYVKSLSAAEARVEWEDGLRPAFAGRLHMSRLLSEADLQLSCDEGGKPAGYTWHITPDQSLAFLARTVRPGTTIDLDQALSPPKSELRDLPRRLRYLRKGDRVLGEVDERALQEGAETGTERLPTVVILRAD